MRATHGEQVGSGLLKNRKGLRVGLVFKVTALIAIAIALVSTVSAYVIFQMGFDALKEEIRNNLVMLSSNATAAINTDKLAMIKSPEDEGSDVYMELQKRLQRIKDASNGKLRYVYIIGKTDNAEQKYQYLIDAVPIEDEENHSAVGDSFSEEKYPQVIKGFEEPTAEKEPMADEEFGGYSQTGYAPIKNENGEVIGVLAVDMDVSIINEKKNDMQRAGLWALSLAVLLALVLGILFSKYLTKPILTLTKGTKSIAEGNLDTLVDVKRNDEFGSLADSFNTMAQDLKRAHDELKQYNLELEEKVALRTSELSQINREIKDILDNMSQAIFTIDDNFLFNPQHSRFAYDIFGSVEFANQNLLDMFFEGNNQKDSREKMELWLNKIFNNTDISWENLEALQPVREVSINTKDRSGKTVTKYIQIVFQPITDILGHNLRQQVTKVMVIVQDITEKRALELQMEQKEREYKDNINQIVEIIKMDQELFQDFIQECQENMANFEPKLITLKNQKDDMTIINDLFRIMHTIKGNARIFNLERIAGEAHGIENIFASIRKGEQYMTDDLLDETFEKLDLFNILFSEMLELYEKIAGGRTPEAAATQEEEAVKEENEVIKVKVHEINRLAELIKKADRLHADNVSGSINAHIGKETIDEIGSIFAETKQQLKALQKTSISKLFNRIPRMVRDLSMELGKKVRVITAGDNIEIDKNILDRISDPIIHILRNSLDHGIEKPEERVSLGKPEEGTIELKTNISENELVVEIKDDGHGLDIDKIKAKAVRNGLITPETALEMPDEEAMRLIFQPGFSTNNVATDISGRGVGMDVVKTAVEEGLKGRIYLQTQKNQGLTILFRIPLAGI